MAFLGRVDLPDGAEGGFQRLRQVVEEGIEVFCRLLVVDHATPFVEFVPVFQHLKRLHLFYRAMR